MLVVCGWCGDELRWDSCTDGVLSHGICEVCLAEQLGCEPRPNFDDLWIDLGVSG